MADPPTDRPTSALAPLSHAIEVVLQEARRNRRRAVRVSPGVRAHVGRVRGGRLELRVPAPAGGSSTTATRFG